MTKSDLEALAGLDSVPWRNLKHAYGPAIDVPELIRTLASGDKKRREETWYTLYGNLWHQGTIYEATSYAVPFLVRLLEARDVCEKQQILLYLAMLFTGRSFWDVHKSTIKSEVSKPGFEEKLNAELEWVAATKLAIKAGKEVYIRQLHGDAVEPKIAGAYLLVLVGESDDEEDERELSVWEEIAKSCEP